MAQSDSDRDATEAKVEFYAGYKGDETPRAIVLEGRRIKVLSVRARSRVLDAATGSVRETWRCRLDDGRTVIVERLDDGTTRV